MNIEDQYNEQFNIEECRNYINEMKQLNNMLFNLKDLADYFDHKKRIYRYKFVYGRQSQLKNKKYNEYFIDLVKNNKHNKYFINQTIENDARNYEYIRSMFQYIIKEQKDLIDKMLHKFNIEQVDINDEDKKEKVIIFDKYNRFNSEGFNNYVNEMDKLQKISIDLNNFLYFANKEVTTLEKQEGVQHIVDWYNDLKNNKKDDDKIYINKIFKEIVLEQKYTVDRVEIEDRG